MNNYYDKGHEKAKYHHRTHSLAYLIFRYLPLCESTGCTSFYADHASLDSHLYTSTYSGAFTNGVCFADIRCCLTDKCAEWYTNTDYGNHTISLTNTDIVDVYLLYF
jgi:hypothetical protein